MRQKCGLYEYPFPEDVVNWKNSWPNCKQEELEEIRRPRKMPEIGPEQSVIHPREETIPERDLPRNFHVHKSPFGKKFDQDKLRTDLIPVDSLEAIAQVFTDGAKKYGDRNWEQGMEHSRLYGAVLRHSFAHWKGETYDQDSGHPHLYHLAASAMMLLALWIRGDGTDNRPR